MKSCHCHLPTFIFHLSSDVGPCMAGTCVECMSYRVCREHVERGII